MVWPSQYRRTDDGRGGLGLWWGSPGTRVFLLGVVVLQTVYLIVLALAPSWWLVGSGALAATAVIVLAAAHRRRRCG